MSETRVRMLEMPVVQNEFGNLAFCEGMRHIPFKIARVYYIYGIPHFAVRGGHAHREQSEVIFALNGRFRVHINDGQREDTFILENPRFGLLLGPMVWRDLYDYRDDSLCMVLSSGLYEPNEYIRDKNAFVSEAKNFLNQG